MSARLREEVDEVVGAVAEVGIVGGEGHQCRAVAAVGIFLEGGAHYSERPRKNLHQSLDQLGGAVTRNDILLGHSPAFRGEQRIDFHARGIFGDEGGEEGLHLFYNARRAEIGVDQIAEVKHGREPPETAVAAVVFAQNVAFVGEDGFGDVEILLVVDLIPFHIADRKSFQIAAAEEGYYAEHVFVVFVVAQCLHVGVEKRNILVVEKFAREFIDVYGLVVVGGLFVAERRFGHEVDDIEVFVDSDHSAVHPALVFGHQRQVGLRVVEKQAEHRVVEYQVALEQNSVVGAKPFLGQRKRVDIVSAVIDGVLDIFDSEAVALVAEIFHQLAAMIADNHHESVESERHELPDHSVDEARAVDFHHAFGVVAGVFAKALAHSGG